MNHQPLPAASLFAPNYPLLTERLVLRPFIRGDVDAVFAYRSLPEVAEYLLDAPLNHEECAEAVRGRAAQVAFSVEGDKILLALERKSDGRLVGEVALIWRSAADQQAEVGYILNPAVWGQGFATEAADAMLEFAFEGACIHRVFARCDARNLGSARVMERLGMRREAHFRQHVRVKGRWDEELIYAILADEWRSRRVARSPGPAV